MISSAAWWEMPSHKNTMLAGERKMERERENQTGGCLLFRCFLAAWGWRWWIMGWRLEDICCNIGWSFQKGGVGQVIRAV